MSIYRALAGGLIVAAGLILSGSSSEAADLAWAGCRSEKPKLSITGCTAVLARGDKETPADRAIAYYNRGNAYFNQGQASLRIAIEDYTHSIQLNPDFADAHFNRGNGYFNAGDLERAIADYDEVLRIDPSYVNAYINRGNAHRKQRDFDAAFADYAAALQLDPANDLAKANRKQALAEQGKVKPKVAALPKLNLPKVDAPKLNAPAKVEAPQVAEPKPGADKAEPEVAVAKPEAPPESSKPPAIAVAERRIALVIGNSGYAAVAKLPNPQRDAEAVAEALRQAGFQDVMLGTDLTRAEIIQALNDFADRTTKADWAVVYFAGHGIELDGVNYIIPVDAKLKSDRDVQDEAVSLDRLASSVEGAKKLKLVILDACRNNPFVTDMRLTVASRAIHRGLARVEPSGGTLIAYAAKGGEEAVDGEETANSPFAAALVTRLATPGLEVGKLFRLVRDDVLAATGHKQEPFVYGSLPGEVFFFRPQ
jgi:tetratricopeptide (TPR) repeat protein